MNPAQPLDYADPSLDYTDPSLDYTDPSPVPQGRREAGKTRVLFVGEGVTLAHVLRPLELARALDRSRYEVHFACDPRYRSLLCDEHIRYAALYTIDPQLFIERATTGRQFHTLRELRRYLYEELALFRRIQPDIVVGDFRVTLDTSTAIQGVPLITLTQAHWSPYSTRECPIPNHPLWDPLGPRLASLIFGHLRPLIFRHLVRNTNRLRASCDLPPIAGLPSLHTRGTLTLYCDIPSFTALSGAPDSHQIIGPIPAEPNVPVPEWGNNLPRGKPVVFVSCGSSGPVDVFKRAIKAVGECPVTPIVASAGRIPSTDLPRGALVADYIPGSWAAGVADLVVCNGGSGTVYQALARGKRVLGIPSNLDQLYVMESVAEHGLGTMLRAKEASPARIRDAVRSLLFSPRLANPAQERVAREIRDWCAPERFAAILERMTDGKPEVANA